MSASSPWLTRGDALGFDAQAAELEAVRRDAAEARARCARGEHRAAGESMPGACADCGVDWDDLDDEDGDPTACHGCRSFGSCQAGCPEHAALSSAEAQILADEEAARVACAAQGHVGVWARADYWSQDADYVCDRCGTPLDEPPPSESTGGAS